MGYKALKQYELAMENFKSMLKIDPNNKRAKELLSDIELSKRVSEITKPEVKSVEPDNGIIHKAGSGDNAGAKTKRKGQRLKIVEIENGDDVTGNNGIEPSALGPGNHQNNENGQPLENGLSDQVGKSSSETSKGILEDSQVINSVKHEQEGMPMDNMVNSETLDNSNLGGVNKSGTENGVDRCLATESGAELKESGADNDVGRCIATESKAGFKNEPGQSSSEPRDSSSVAEDERLKKPEPAQNEKETILEIPENVKNFMKEGNNLYKMGHHSEALEKYSTCVKYLWS
ncbi:---NA---, partial [Paramuricea clavata]